MSRRGKGGGRGANTPRPGGKGGGRAVALSPSAAAPMLDGDEWFGPGRPMQPIAPRSTAGRRFDYQFGQNLQIRPRWNAPISFQQLRYLADSHDLTRLAIETRKDQMSRLSWTIGIVDSEDKLSAEQEARAATYRRLLRRPDGQNFWHDWLRMVLEDLLVIDAPSIFVRRTMDESEVVGLCQVDGSTIMPIVDSWGRTPEPPETAYQQILHGMPAVDYTTRQLVYRPRNGRVHTVWGYSPVEQIIALINIALRRQLWQHTYFTDGNIPDSLIGVPSTWSPDQIRDFQDWFDSVLSGNTERRRGAMFVPGEVAKSYVPTKDAEMFGHGEEWLARVVCFAFSIPHQALVKEINRATAESSHEQALEDGLAPIMGWVKNLLDGILIDQFEETELEFRWSDDKELDPKTLDEMWKARIDAGMADRNEWRSEVGLEARTEPEASMLMASSLNNPSPISVDAQIELQRQRQASGVFPTPPPPGTPPGTENDTSSSSGRVVATEGQGGGAAKAASSSTSDPRYRRLAVVRPSVERQRVRLQRVIERGLSRVGARVVTAVEAVLQTTAKAAEDDRAELIQRALEAIGSWDFLIDATEQTLEAVFLDTGQVAAAMIGGAHESELVDQVSERAVDWARQRAAEMVGKRILQNGDIVDNPDARWAISDSTRTMIQDTITSVLRDNLGSDEIIRTLEETHAFSPARAEMVSRTEVAQVNTQAAMSTYRDAQDLGVVVQKEWLPGSESCEICLGNEADGPIGLDESFSSGDDETPAHPNCTCATVPFVAESDA